MARSNMDLVMVIAEEHDGVVSAREAAAAGIQPATLVKMAKRGRLERLARGVYRVPTFPHSARRFEQYQEALAWLMANHGPEAVISHETALVVYGLSDAMPEKIHLTIPETVRLRRDVPQTYIVHWAHLDLNEITIVEGLRITTVVRTIADVIIAGRNDLAQTAIRDALRDGWITKKAASRLRAGKST